MILVRSYAGSGYLKPLNSAENIDPFWGLITMIAFLIFVTYIALRVRFEIKNEKHERPDRKFRSFNPENKDKNTEADK